MNMGIRISDKKYEELIGQYDAVILGVAHDEFKGKNLRDLLKDNTKGVLYDVKGIVERHQLMADCKKLYCQFINP